jgi:hypothetical protein
MAPKSGQRNLTTLLKATAAGAAGTAAMTVAQMAYYKVTGSESSSTPAEVAKKIIRAVSGREVPDEYEVLLNNLIHWLYGTSWGTAYGLARPQPGQGVVFGAGVWSASLVELPLLGLSPPVWKMKPSQIAPDLGFHLLYGVAVAQTGRRLAD